MKNETLIFDSIVSVRRGAYGEVMGGRGKVGYERFLFFGAAEGAFDA